MIALVGVTLTEVTPVPSVLLLWISAPAMANLPVLCYTRYMNDDSGPRPVFGLPMDVRLRGYNPAEIADECSTDLAVGGFQCVCGFWLPFWAELIRLGDAGERPTYAPVSAERISGQSYACAQCGAVYDVTPI